MYWKYMGIYFTYCKNLDFLFMLRNYKCYMILTIFWPSNEMLTRRLSKVYSSKVHLTIKMWKRFQTKLTKYHLMFVINFLMAITFLISRRQCYSLISFLCIYQIPYDEIIMFWKANKNSHDTKSRQKNKQIFIVEEKHKQKIRIYNAIKAIDFKADIKFIML